MFSAASTSRAVASPASRKRQASSNSQVSDMVSGADENEHTSNGNSSRRKVNRANPQMSYAYGAPSDGKQPTKKARISGEAEKETGAAAAMSPPMKTPEPVDAVTRYKAVRERQQRGQVTGRPSVGAAASPRRSSRLSAGGSQDATSQQERKVAITSIEEDQAVEDEEEALKGGSSVQRQDQRMRPMSPGQSRSVNAHLSSFYLDAGRSNGDGASDDRNGLPTSLLRGAQRPAQDIGTADLSGMGMSSVKSSDMGDSHSYDYEEEERFARMMDTSQRTMSNLASAILRSPKALFSSKEGENHRADKELVEDTSLERKKKKGRVSADDRGFRPQGSSSEEESEASDGGRKHGHRRKKVEGKLGARGGRDDNKIWMSAGRRKGGKRRSIGGDETIELTGEDVEEEEAEQQIEGLQEHHVHLKREKTNARAKASLWSLVPSWALVLCAVLLLGSLNIHTRTKSDKILDLSTLSRIGSSSDPVSLAEASDRIVKLEAAMQSLKAVDLWPHLNRLEKDTATLSKQYANSQAMLQDQVKAIKEDSKQLQTEVDRLQSTFKSMRSSAAKEDAATSNALKKRLESLEGHMKANDRLLEEVSEKAKSAERTALQAREGMQWLEQKLPTEIAVPIEASSGKPVLDDEILKAMKAIFIGRDEYDFRSKNEEAIQILTKELLDDKIQTGILLGRDTFLDLLQQELEKVKVSLEARFNANVGELQNEILAKVRTQQDMYERAGSWTKAASRRPSAEIVDQVQIPTKDGQDARAAILAMIDDALEVYSTDRIGRKDYALYSGGGRIIHSLTSPTYHLPIQTSLWDRIRGSVKAKKDLLMPAVAALHQESYSGMCWAFPGDDGYLGVGLARNVLVTHVTLEHLPASISLEEGASAPRDVEVWGMVESKEDINKLAAYRRTQAGEDSPTSAPPSYKHYLLASFTYDISAPRAVQTFSIAREAQRLQIPTRVVQVHVTSNHGNKDFTCLYRIRVHGDEIIDD